MRSDIQRDYLVVTHTKNSKVRKVPISSDLRRALLSRTHQSGYVFLETHRAVFTWVQQRLVEAGQLQGKTIAIDATTLEANAAMRSIVRRDTGESYQACLTGLARASGIETPTRETLARLDRTRKKKTSNTDWTTRMISMRRSRR